MFIGGSILIFWREARSAGDPDWQGFIAFHKTRIHPLGLLDHLNVAEALEDFFPDDLELQLGKSQPDTAMYAEAERNVGARPRPVDYEFIRTLDHLLVAIAGDVPHHDLVAFFDLLAAEFNILERGPAHVRQWRLPADHFGHETVDQFGIGAQLAVLIRILVQGI